MTYKFLLLVHFWYLDYKEILEKRQKYRIYTLEKRQKLCVFVLEKWKNKDISLCRREK